MTSSDRSSRKAMVLIVDTGNPEAAEIEAMVARNGGYRSARISANDLKRLPGMPEPAVVVLDLKKASPKELDQLTLIRGAFGDVPIIIVSEEIDDATMRGLLKLKVQDWQRKPINEAEFINALNSSIRTSRQAQSRVHAVISAVGGAGGTSVSITLADVLTRKMGGQKSTVGLFDLDFATGACGYYLNMTRSFSLESVITNPGRIDAEFVSLMQQRHSSGFSLYSFKRREFVTHMNCYEMVLRMLDIVTMEHPVTILDIPYYATDWEQDVLSGVNSVYLVTDLNIPAIKQTLDTIRMLESLPGGSKPVTVLLNKQESSLFGRPRISKARLKELFGNTPLEYLPADPSVLGEALDRGVLPSEVNSRSGFVRAVSKIAEADILAEQAKSK